MTGQAHSSAIITAAKTWPIAQCSSTSTPPAVPLQIMGRPLLHICSHEPCNEISTSHEGCWVDLSAVLSHREAGKRLGRANQVCEGLAVSLLYTFLQLLGELIPDCLLQMWTCGKAHQQLVLKRVLMAMPFVDKIAIQPELLVPLQNQQH